MIKGIYTIRDEASTLYMDLQVSVNNDVAIRNFDYAMAHTDIMSFRPEDFSLWYLGDYDDVTGIIEAKPPKILKRGVKKGGRKV